MDLHLVTPRYEFPVFGDVVAYSRIPRTTSRVIATNLICTGLAASVTPVNVGRSHDLSARNRRVAYKRNVVLRDEPSQLQGSSCAAPAERYGGEI
jgi:hypothetical protein